MEIVAALERQRAWFRTGATRPPGFRRARLEALHDGISARETEILKALHADLRKSPQEAYASEVGFVQSELHHALRHLAGWMKPQRRRVPLMAWPAKGFVVPEPYGISLVIGPWNYPFQLLLSPLVGALAAGNCAVLKTSEFAPHTSTVVARLIREVFHEEHVVVLEGGREVAEALLRERFDKIFFTGSTTVGRKVMRAAAQHLTPVTLELGGKSPCLVCVDAPLDVTARRIAWGKFLNAGQTCVAPDYVLVDRRIREPFLRAMNRTLVEFFGEHPQRSPDYGRIVNRHHFDRLIGYLDSGRLIRGGQHDVKDLYLAPTLLTDLAPDATVMQEEIFGPILPVVEFAALDDALAGLRERPVPLALYLFTQDRAIQERVLAKSRSGGVALNDTVLHMVGKNLPFGGLGDSGFGVYHGRASFDCFTHYRSVLRRSFFWDVRHRYPPQRTPLKTLKRLMGYLLRG